MIGNFGVTNEKNEIRDASGNLLKRAEEDVVRVYAIWNIDFSALLRK
jgi:hypothetical protein